MTPRVEDAVRDVLAVQVDGIVPPPGWETRVLRAAHRRRRRRRTAVGAGVLAAVAVLGLGGVSGVLPRALTSPFDMAGQLPIPDLPRVAPSDLPTGKPPTIPYSYGGVDRQPGDTVALPSGGPWKTGGFVRALEQAGDGVLAVVETARPPVRLVYRTADGHETTLATGNIDGVAASADGSKVAWATSPGNGPGSRLHLATLPDGKVVATKVVTETGIDHYAGVAAFIGDKVLLDFDRALADHPYAEVWDPARGRIAPLLGPTYAGKGGAVVGADVADDAVYLLDSHSCLHSISLAHPTTERWKACVGRMKTARLSADGRRIAGFDKNGDGLNELWVRDTRSGKVLAKRELLDASVEATSWESPGTLLMRYVDMDGDRLRDGATSKILRCSANLRTCSRVPLPAKTGERALQSRQGADPPATDYALN